MPKLVVAVMIAAGLAIAGWAFLMGADTKGGSAGLAALHRDIVSDYPGLTHLTVETLQTRPRGDYILFDVREADEYAVSHLPGALRVDPSLDKSKFLSLYQDRLAGKLAVFYCSVGRRSSDYAFKLSKKNPSADFAVANLTGGIFGWRNDSRRLVRGAEETDLVHPYNDYWGRFLDDPSARSYTPR